MTGYLNSVGLIKNLFFHKVIFILLYDIMLF